jgi:hypothetical protein
MRLLNELRKVALSNIEIIRSTTSAVWMVTNLVAIHLGFTKEANEVCRAENHDWKARWAVPDSIQSGAQPVRTRD